MGTAVHRAISVEKMAESKAPGYDMKGYTFDGMDFISCYAGFEHVYKEVVQTQRPVLVEVLSERFKGHSISDPGLYRSKESLKACMLRDPLLILKQMLVELQLITEEEFQRLDKKYRE